MVKQIRLRVSHDCIIYSLTFLFKWYLYARLRLRNARLLFFFFRNKSVICIFPCTPVCVFSKVQFYCGFLKQMFLRPFTNVCSYCLFWLCIHTRFHTHTDTDTSSLAFRDTVTSDDTNVQIFYFSKNFLTTFKGPSDFFFQGKNT